MKLDKSDAVLIHSAIFSYVNTNASLTDEAYEQLIDIQDRLHDFLAREDESHAHEDSESSEDTSRVDDDEDYEDEEDYEEEEEEEAEEDEEEPAIELRVTTQSASDLSPISVVSPSGSKISLEFEDVGEPDSVDALLDNGTVIIDSVSCVVLTEQNISLYDGEEWHDFKIKKPSKSWKRVFSHGKNVGFEGGEEE